MSGQAIFLSYASQDADAARRICDALRAAGLEVWFDQSELRGGDAWDANIRKQIKECALFVPIISANTNSREEGYFRREWNLAVNRMLDMDEHRTFLLPVLLAGVSERDALVPDKFRERQWTRITDDVSIQAFAARVKLLCDGGLTASVNAAPSGDAAVTTASHPSAPPAPPRRKWLTLGLGAATFAGAGVAFSLWKPWRAFTQAGGASSGPGDPQLKRAGELIDSFGGLASDVSLAEDIVKNALAARPTDADATVMMARIQVYTLQRGFDRSEDRYALAKQFTERALAIAPNDPDAMAATAMYLRQRNVDLPRARKLIDDAIALNPNVARHHRLRGSLAGSRPGVTYAEIVATAKATVEKFPNDALAYHDLGLIFQIQGRFTEAAPAFERAVELGPVPSSITALANIKLWVEGDLAGMKATLDRTPEKHRTSQRVVLGYFTYGLMGVEADVGLAALRAVPAKWIRDLVYTGPTALLIGELLLSQRKTELAQLRFEEAFAELRKQMQASPLDPVNAWLEPFLLMRTGRVKEARARNAIFFGELKRPYGMRLSSYWWTFDDIPNNLQFGERVKAIELMREAAIKAAEKRVMRNAMRLDPRMAPFRNDPEIVKILAEPAAERVAKP